MQLPFATVNVFTTTRYVGNPLAIVQVPAALRSRLTSEQKQKIAREFNLSETTFLHEPTEPHTTDYDIFTPLSQLAFAGHPTIGTAVYAASTPSSYPGISQLKTLAGTIPFTYSAATQTATVSVPHAFHVHQKRLPHPFPAAETNPSPSTTVPLVSIVRGMAFNLVPLCSTAALALPSKSLLPAEEIYKAEHLDPGSGWDVGYTGTYFYVDLGPDPEDSEAVLLRTRSISTREDPGTGSAACALCAYLAVEGWKKGEGRERRFHVTQGVEMGRRSDIYLRVGVGEGGELEWVEMSGAAVRVMEGVLEVE